jgi:hypothetical protein
MPEPGPGQLQERLGGGRDTSDRRRLRRHLQKLEGALQKVRPPRRQVPRKILRNKHPPSSNRCHFIYTFAFVCIHTSYAEGQHVMNIIIVRTSPLLLRFPFFSTFSSLSSSPAVSLASLYLSGGVRNKNVKAPTF